MEKSKRNYLNQQKRKRLTSCCIRNSKLRHWTGNETPPIEIDSTRKSSPVAVIVIHNYEIITYIKTLWCNLLITEINKTRVELVFIVK